MNQIVKKTDQQLILEIDQFAKSKLNQSKEQIYLLLLYLITGAKLLSIDIKIIYQFIVRNYYAEIEQKNGLIDLCTYIYDDAKLKIKRTPSDKNIEYCLNDHFTPFMLSRLEDTDRNATNFLRAGKFYKGSKLYKMHVNTSILDKELIDAIFSIRYEYYYKQYGINNGGYLTAGENILSDKISIYQNIVTDEYHYIIKNGDGSKHSLNIYILEKLLSDQGYNFKNGQAQTYLKSANITKFDPIKNYFDSLNKWDGADYISNLCDYISMPDTDKEMFRSIFKKFLVKCISCALGFSVNRHVLVLCGKKQESGKSTFLRWLCPPDLEAYYSETPIRGNTDDHLRLNRTFFYNLEELQSLSKSDINALKAYISTKDTNERVPYDRISLSRPRRTNFIASTNRETFLTDESGNTRWLVFLVTKFNFDYKTQININDVWGQAYSLYLDNYDFELSEAEHKWQEFSNKKFEVHYIEHDLISQNFRVPTTKNDCGMFFTNAQLISILQTNNKTGINIRENIFGRAMVALGYKEARKTVKGKSHRGYYVSSDSIEKEVAERTKKETLINFMSAIFDGEDFEEHYGFPTEATGASVLTIDSMTEEQIREAETFLFADDDTNVFEIDERFGYQTITAEELFGKD